MSNELPRAVTVRWCKARKEADLYALVLSSRGITSLIVADGQGASLLVAPQDVDRARDELAAYDAENERRGKEGRRFRPIPPNLEFLLAYWAVLLFFFAAARSYALSIDWLAIGAAQVGLISQGEWWRTVTALFLHESGIHLLSNLVFGTLFLLLLSQVLGPGMTALAVVLAGAAGNSLDAIVRPASHTLIGSSTAIFAAVGLLAALRLDWRGGPMFSSLRDWAPIAGGIMLLAFLGFGNGQTDILAHVFGFFSGLCLGVLLSWLDRPWREDSFSQIWSAWAAGGVAALAWLCAILVRS